MKFLEQIKCRQVSLFHHNSKCQIYSIGLKLKSQARFTERLTHANFPSSVVLFDIVRYQKKYYKQLVVLWRYAYPPFDDCSKIIGPAAEQQRR